MRPIVLLPRPCLLGGGTDPDSLLSIDYVASTAAAR